MGLFTGFEKGSGGRYIYTAHGMVKISDNVPTNDAGFNGPVWFPKCGYKYYDRALQKEFTSKQEKKDFLKSNNLVQAATDKGQPRTCEARGAGKTYYSYSGLKTCSRGYKRR